MAKIGSEPSPISQIITKNTAVVQAQASSDVLGPELGTSKAQAKNFLMARRKASLELNTVQKLVVSMLKLIISN